MGFRGAISLISLAHWYWADVYGSNADLFRAPGYCLIWGKSRKKKKGKWKEGKRSRKGKKGRKEDGIKKERRTEKKKEFRQKEKEILLLALN